MSFTSGFFYKIAFCQCFFISKELLKGMFHK